MRRSPECSLGYEHWPDVDRALWLAKMEAGSLFDEARPGARLSAASRRGRMYAYRSFLGFLNNTFPQRLADPPAARIDRKCVAGYVQYLRETCSDVTVAITLDRLYSVLVAFGGADLKWLRKIQRRIARNAKQKARPPVASDELRQLGIDLMDQALAEVEANGVVLDRQSKLYRDGLMIALLATIPLRRSSLAAIRLGRQLVKVGAEWNLAIPEEDTKNGDALEYTIGPNLSGRIDCYLERFRPAVAGAEKHDGLWASRRGTPMVGNTILQAITRRTIARFGYAVSPHRFRHAAASFWSVADPTNVRGAKALLGHRSFGTTEKYYIQAQTLVAGRVLAATISASGRSGGRDR